MSFDIGPSNGGEERLPRNDQSVSKADVGTIVGALWVCTAMVCVTAIIVALILR